MLQCYESCLDTGKVLLEQAHEFIVIRSQATASVDGKFKTSSCKIVVTHAVKGTLRHASGIQHLRGVMRGQDLVIALGHTVLVAWESSDITKLNDSSQRRPVKVVDFTPANRVSDSAQVSPLYMSLRAFCAYAVANSRKLASSLVGDARWNAG